jgi:uncharacterized protein (TIGR02246 family)
VWLAAALILAPVLVRAQTTLSERKQRERAVAAELDVESQELVTLEKETAHALSLNNSSFFARIYNDDYVGTAASGEMRDKQALLASIQKSSAKYYSFIVSNIDVRVYGPSAVVTCTWTTRGEQDGRNFSRQYRIIHVYISNREGSWRVVAGQETLLPG